MPKRSSKRFARHFPLELLQQIAQIERVMPRRSCHGDLAQWQKTKNKTSASVHAQTCA